MSSNCCKFIIYVTISHKENMSINVLLPYFIYTYHVLFRWTFVTEESENEKLFICWNQFFQENQYSDDCECCDYAFCWFAKMNPGFRKILEQKNSTFGKVRWMRKKHNRLHFALNYQNKYALYMFFCTMN